MMPPTLLFALNRTQADQLCRWCASYRAYAWQHLEPTPERNQTMKVAQAVQGRLTALQTGDAEALCLVVSEDEKQVLRQLISTLMQLSGAETASEERNRALGELASLRTLIERMARHTPSLETERSPSHLWQR